MIDSTSDNPVPQGERVEGLAADPGARGQTDVGFLEILLYATGDRRLVLSLDGSGGMPRLDLAFRSGAELGDFVADLLASGDTLRHPVLAALREAVGRLGPPA